MAAAGPSPGEARWARWNGTPPRRPIAGLRLHGFGKLAAGESRLMIQPDRAGARCGNGQRDGSRCRAIGQRIPFRHRSAAGDLYPCCRPVALYHAGVPGFTGGFVGVDVFFVISGFLITRLLLEEAATTGTIDIVRFWARRARRLLPNALLVLLAILVIGGCDRTAPLAQDARQRRRGGPLLRRQFSVCHTGCRVFPPARRSAKPSASLLVAEHRGAVLHRLAAAAGDGRRCFSAARRAQRGTHSRVGVACVAGGRARYGEVQPAAGVLPYRRALLATCYRRPARCSTSPRCDPLAALAELGNLVGSGGYRAQYRRL